jgi:DNA-binding MarR family transcriptional regulator
MSDDFLKASGLHEQPGFVLRQASIAVWQDLVRTLEPFGLKPQSYATLLLVAATPGCKQQDVADALDIQRPNMVALIDRLVDAGWLRRDTNSADRRSYALHLTDAGQKLLVESQGAHRAHEERVADLLGRGASKDFVESCMRLTRLVHAAP